MQYCKEKLNFEGLKSLIESITKQLWPQLQIASWDVSYHIKIKKTDQKKWQYTAYFTYSK